MNVYLVRTHGSGSIQGVHLDEESADAHVNYMSDDRFYVDIWPVTTPEEWTL